MVIKIHPNGNIIMLYRDQTRPLMDAIGDISVKRASDVVFESGLWYVQKDDSYLIKEGFYNRNDAINAEVEYLERSI